jgi:hypothetical protein
VIWRGVDVTKVTTKRWSVASGQLKKMESRRTARRTEVLAKMCRLLKPTRGFNKSSPSVEDAGLSYDAQRSGTGVSRGLSCTTNTKSRSTFA